MKTLLFGSEVRPRLLKRGLLHGLSFFIDPSNKSQRLLGIEEAEVERVTRRFAQRAKTAVDVGANDGWYSIFFAAQGNIEKVYACEPEAKHLHLLQRNVLLNGPSVEAKIEFIPSFIGSEEKGEVRSLDKVLQRAVYPVVIKVDVDGGELEVLRGAHEVLASHDALLIVETHSVELEEACIHLLAEKGYRCSIIKNAWYRLFIPELRPIPHNRWLSAEPL